MHNDRELLPLEILQSLEAVRLVAHEDAIAVLDETISLYKEAYVNNAIHTNRK